MKPIPLAATLLSSGLALSPLHAPLPTPPSCPDITDHPAAYLGSTVTVLAIKHSVSSTTVEGKMVVLQIYGCSDALGSVQDHEHLFALAPREAVTDSSAGNHVSQRVTGIVHLALEVPMQSGRFQVKRVMPFLTHVTIQAP